MIKKKAFVFIGIIIGVFFLASAFSFSQAQAKELKLGHNGSPLSPTQKASLKFADLVKQKTGGKVTVAVYPAAQLGKPPEMLRSVSMGSVDIFFGATGWYARVEKDWKLHNLPFVVKDAAHLMRILKSPVGQEMFEKVRKKAGILTLSFSGLRPPRNLISKRPVYSVADVKGLKLRVPEVKSYIEAWKAMGALPIPITWSETYLALGQGIVDAVEGSLPNLYHSKFYEFAKYCSLLEYKPATIVFCINEKAFLGFPSEIQKSLKDSAEKAGEYLAKIASEEVSVVVKKMKEAGVMFIKVDVEAFSNKTADLPERLEKEGNWTKGLYRKWSSVN